MGVLLIAALAGLCVLDHRSVLPGAWLMPIALLLSLLASGEMVRLCASAGLKPLAATVYCGNFLLVLSAWLQLPSAADWTTLVLAVLVLAAFCGEMFRYKTANGAIANLGSTVLSLAYVGVMLAVMVKLRLTYGIGALVSLVIVVKMGDTGAYTLGRLFGRHKMAPLLSPGKTLEGAVGAVVFSLLGAWLSFSFLVPILAKTPAGMAATAVQTPWWGWVLFGVAVGVAGMLADLAESLLKRAANCKDSSAWLPGFGGVLDIMDSLLLAAPIAYVFYALGLVKNG